MTTALAFCGGFLAVRVVGAENALQQIMVKFDRILEMDRPHGYRGSG